MSDVYALSQSQLAEQFAAWGAPAFRAKQVWSWLYDKRVASWDAMTNLPKALRAQMSSELSLGTLSVHRRQESADGTVKWLYRLHDGKLIESVLMPYRDGRRTVCISSQAGCAMRCSFCATGQMGFDRQLTPTEIFEQVLRAAQETAAAGDRLSNVVLMGMGEPFHNYDAVLTAVRRMISDLGIGARHITISTVGLAPQIRRFATEGLQVRLAVSLHAAHDARRSAMMPVNRRWDIAELLSACRDYVDATSRRVTFEWALIAGENDSAEEATALAKRLSGLPCHVNVIPLNPTGGYEGGPSAAPAVRRFVSVLEERGIPATIRVRRGIDIDAGCGQLRAREVSAASATATHETEATS